MNKKNCVFAGSFDPITNGHLEIISKSLSIFDEVIIAIGTNREKKHMFSLKQRKKFIEEVYKNMDKVKVDTYTGLTVDYCKTKNVNFLLRGIRNTLDFEYEKSIAQTNSQLNFEIETILFFTSPEYANISSSMVRDIIKNKGDFTKFIPKKILPLI